MDPPSPAATRPHAEKWKISLQPLVFDQHFIYLLTQSVADD